ncbi:MAG: hypothetical protein HZB14_07095 [Actinobacteria bacterium]|nr:hypothetical protein [Actinomycetota bacterium]
MNVSARTTRFLVALLALCAIALSGCDKEVKTHEAKEGGRIYLDGLFYQVQLSRQLNIKDVEDSYYLADQPAPEPGEAYFGVFMRVDNEENGDEGSKKRILPISTEHMKIVDAKGNEFEPLEVHGEGWGYAPAPLGNGAHLPIPDTPAGGGTIRGGLILFRLTTDDLDSRPLELEIESPKGDKAAIVLDV